MTFSDWSTQIFRYCERGSDPALWAEPLNAITNLGFLAVAVFSILRLSSQQSGTPVWNNTGARVRFVLISLVAIIALGSFSFHTFATRLAQLGDVIPIGMFMFAYLAFALQHFLQLRPITLLVSLVAFAVAGYMATTLTGPGGLPYLNGTLSYLPALIALCIVGLALLWRGDRAARWFLGAGIIFTVSMAFRSVDMVGCARFSLAGYVTGTHFLWHILNALMLYLLLRAALEPHGGTDDAPDDGRAVTD